MSIVINGSGTITGITAGGLPDATITQAELATGVAGTGPAFSAYQTGTAQVVGANTWTKITCNTEEFDTNSNYDNATNYRFTPTVSGYYQVSATIQYGGDSTTGAAIYKNSGLHKTGHFSSSGQGRASNVSAVVYLNGSTDYVEFYAYCNVTGTVSTGVASTWFQASMVRAA